VTRRNTQSAFVKLKLVLHGIMILKTSDPEYSDHDQIPAGSRSGPDTLPEIASTPQDAARHPAAAHLQHRQISSFPNCSSRALLQLQAYLFTSSAGSRIKLRRLPPARVSCSSRLPRRPGRGRKKDKEVVPHGSPSGLKENLPGSLQPRVIARSTPCIPGLLHANN